MTNSNKESFIKALEVSRKNPFKHTCKGERYLTSCSACKWDTYALGFGASEEQIRKMMYVELKRNQRQ